MNFFIFFVRTQSLAQIFKRLLLPRNNECSAQHTKVTIRNWVTFCGFMPSLGVRSPCFWSKDLWSKKCDRSKNQGWIRKFCLGCVFITELGTRSKLYDMTFWYLLLEGIICICILILMQDICITKSIWIWNIRYRKKYLSIII